MDSLLVHDFAGHPFQIELSRSLARRNRNVFHAFSSDAVTGKGKLDLSVGDPVGLRIVPITPRVSFARYSPIGRVRFEIAYARELVRYIKLVNPDVLITCNTPLFVLAILARYLRRSQQPWILWHQDIVSIAVHHEAMRKLPRPLAALIGYFSLRIEKRAVKSASCVVPIGEFFIDQYGAWGLKALRTHVIPNWAPLDDIFPLDKSNPWGAAQGLNTSEFRLVYAGTLGRKHNPKLLVDLIDSVRALGVDASLLVVSEGDGADNVKALTAGRTDVRVLPYQPIEDLPGVLGTADVVVGLLEPDAARFSVPSKVLSYLAAGRATLLMAPSSNPAVSTVTAAGGLAVSPDADGVRTGSRWIAELARSPGMVAQLGSAARSYAEQHFSIDAICDQFDEVCKLAGGYVQQPVTGGQAPPVPDDAPATAQIQDVSPLA